MSETTKKELQPTEERGIFKAPDDCNPILSHDEFTSKVIQVLKIVQREYNDESPAPWTANTISSALRVLLSRVPAIGQIIFGLGEDNDVTIDDVHCVAFFVASNDIVTSGQQPQDIMAVFTVKFPYKSTSDPHYSPLVIGVRYADDDTSENNRFDPDFSYHTVSEIITGLLNSAVIHQWDSNIVVDVTAALLVDASSKIRTIDTRQLIPCFEPQNGEDLNGSLDEYIPDYASIAKSITTYYDTSMRKSANGGEEPSFERVNHIKLKYYYPKDFGEYNNSYAESEFNSNSYLISLCKVLEDNVRISLQSIISEADISVDQAMENLLELFGDPLKEVINAHKKLVQAMISSTYEGNIDVAVRERDEDPAGSHFIMITLHDIYLNGTLQIKIGINPHLDLDESERSLSYATSYLFRSDAKYTFGNLILHKERPVVDYDVERKAITSMEDSQETEEIHDDSEYTCDNQAEECNTNDGVSIFSPSGIFGRVIYGCCPDVCGNNEYRFPIRFIDETNGSNMELCTCIKNFVNSKLFGIGTLTTFTLSSLESQPNYISMIKDIDDTTWVYVVSEILRQHINDKIAMLTHQKIDGVHNSNIVTIAPGIDSYSLQVTINIDIPEPAAEIIYNRMEEIINDFVVCLEISYCAIKHYLCNNHCIENVKSMISPDLYTSEYYIYSKYLKSELAIRSHNTCLR